MYNDKNKIKLGVWSMFWVRLIKCAIYQSFDNLKITILKIFYYKKNIISFINLIKSMSILIKFYIFIAILKSF